MIGPSGPMQRPEGTLAIIPAVLANIVCQEVNEVFFPVTGEIPPFGSTPFK